LKLKRFGVATAALALALSAGCGGGSGSGSATADGGDLTKANFASEVTKAQSAAETAHLEAKVGASGQQMSMSGDMRMRKQDLAFDLAMTGGAMGGEARFILVDQVVYAKMPGLSQGDKYIKVDMAKGDNPAAQMFQQMMSQFDPSKTFQGFKAATQVQERGTQEIDGVETTRYAVTVDTRKALKAQGMDQQVPSGQMPKTIKYDVWVDADNLVRKLVMNVQGNSVDMTLSQWGEPVEITAPPANQTTDIEQMMGQMGGAAPKPRS
jgi:lipoprotein LprG